MPQKKKPSIIDSLLPDYDLKFRKYEENGFVVIRSLEIYNSIKKKIKLQEIFVSGIDWQNKDRNLSEGSLAAIILDEPESQKKPLLLKISEVSEFHDLSKAVKARDYRFGFKELSENEILRYYHNMFFEEHEENNGLKYFLASFDYFEKAKLYVPMERVSLLSDFCRL